ncbi:putative peptidase M1, alanine aminopeptidase/leukotriene A4 hydrolase [Plasmopara halstedii]
MGVMENWGLVTYAETFLLVDEKLSSYEIKADAARAICHVLSNHWFGSLVTMAWWTGLWLSERFAQFDAAHHIYPELKLWDTFVQDVMLGSAFVKDAMISSHPDEADEIFNAFSYHKGSSIVGCCTNIVDIQPCIGKGVWSKIENMTDTWTKQVGFPLVTVKQDADGHCIFQQERFLTDSSLNVDDNSLRDIPLTSAHRMILIRSIVLNFETQKPQR